MLIFEFSHANRLSWIQFLSPATEHRMRAYGGRDGCAYLGKYEVVLKLFIACQLAELWVTALASGTPRSIVVCNHTAKGLLRAVIANKKKTTISLISVLLWWCIHRHSYLSSHPSTPQSTKLPNLSCIRQSTHPSLNLPVHPYSNTSIHPSIHPSFIYPHSHLLTHTTAIYPCYSNIPIVHLQTHLRINPSVYRGHYTLKLWIVRFHMYYDRHSAARLTKPNLSNGTTGTKHATSEHCPWHWECPKTHLTTIIVWITQLAKHFKS